jgi:hypothetical protein
MFLGNNLQGNIQVESSGRGPPKAPFNWVKKLGSMKAMEQNYFARQLLTVSIILPALSIHTIASSSKKASSGVKSGRPFGYLVGI